MRDIEAFLTELVARDVKLWVEEDALHCKAPKGALTPDLRAELGARKPEIIAFLRGMAGDSRLDGSISPIPRNKPLPLSFAQQRLWFLEQLEPGLATYNVPIALRLNGRLDVAALEQSLNEIVRRHESLRTVFTVVDEQPMQVIAPALSLRLPVDDLSKLPESEREAEVQRLTAEEAQQPYDLSRGPLVRVSLLKLSEMEHVLQLNIHHIAFDGWSMGVFNRELTALYAAFSAGKPSPLLELPIQYADFAAWQRAWLQGGSLDKQLVYWKQQLGDIPPVLELPADRPQPPVRTFRGAFHSFMLPLPLSQALKTFSQRERATLFMTLLAAFKALLSRYTGQTDIVVASLIANRRRAEIEGLIGCFINTLVLRTDLSGNPSFRELLAREREVTLGAYANQDMPVEKLLEELPPERNLSHNPLFQVLFVLQNAPTKQLDLAELSPAFMRVERKATDLDLSLHMEETERGLAGYLEYNTDIFDAGRIARLASHLQTLLEGIVADPGQRLSNLPLLTEAERHQTLMEWNNTQAEYSTDKSIQELFEAQVERTPDKVAVVFEDQHLTYRELNQRANQLAHYLRKRGVGPEVLVGICLERSPEMIVGLLGILKAGGAYLPLDPAYPKKRLAFMLADAQPAALLTQAKLVEDFPAYKQPVIFVDTDWEAIARESAASLPCVVTGENLAYLIYTSGSTGLPKGVMIRQQALVNFCETAIASYEMRSSDRVLQFAALSFDTSVEEIYPCLICGAALVLRTEAVLSSIEVFLQKCQEWSLTILNLPTAYWHELTAQLEADHLSMPPSLRLVIIGGEGALPERVTSWTKLAPPEVRLVNTYGATEATAVTTLGRLTSLAHEQDAHTISIGRPIANVQIHILDAHLQPMPIGVPGELCISGEGLARGYLERPGLTAEKFIPNLFSSEPGARLYRTGDLACWQPDGNIEFLGRIDNQVKIRGFRIELGEIEPALGQHSGVREGVVIAHLDASGDKRLVAYLVLQEGQRLAVSELRSFLKDKLPDYMLPAAFVMLDTLPLTPSGKVDRRALPAPGESSLELAEDFAAPRTPTEEALAGIWAEVLHLERVGVRHNFFELGGHSLLAMQVVSRVRAAFQVELSLRDLFEATTIAELAGSVDQAMTGTTGRPMLAVGRAARNGPLPLSFAQQRLWFLEQLEPGQATYNVPIALRLNGRLDVTALEQSLNEIVHRHESLRTVFTVVDEQPMQVIAPALSLRLPVDDLSKLPESEREAEVQRLTAEEAQQPYDLSRGPLVRVSLLKLSEMEHVLQLNIHHIAFDGWSMGVFNRELTALYSAFSKGESLPLPELPIQYADFAAWQRAWLQGGALDKQLAYWKQQLGDIPPVLELPADRPQPVVRTFRGALHTFMLPLPLSQALKTLSQRERATLFMTLLAAFKALLSRYTGQTDVVVASLIANRRHAEIEELIGCFINTLVLRTDLSGNPSFRELLAREREVTLGAYANQDMPVEKLLEELPPERNLSHNPLFQVLFVLQNAPTKQLDLAELSPAFMRVERKATDLDLSLHMEETERGLAGYLEYNTDIFDAGRIARLASHLQTLLEGIVADPGQRLSNLPLLTEAERHQTLMEWNNTQAEYSTDKSIQELFEAQVERTPDKVAVVFEDQHLTYRELNQRANQLAHYLRKRGVGPEVLVGICLERSPEMIVGLLGILKAGGAYLPLDPAYPKKRLAFMLADAQPAALLTQAKLVEDFPAYKQPVIFVDTDWEAIARESAASLPCVVTGENLAYLIYTSGSTGLPKGVMIRQQALVNFCETAIASYEMRSSDRVLQFAALSFDTSVEEIYPCLICGAALVLRTEAVLSSIEVFLQKCQEWSLTILNLPTAYWHELTAQLEADHLSMPPSLRLVIIGGEGALPERVTSWTKLAPPEVRLVNTYGATEATAVTTLGRLTSLAHEQDAHTISIGRPIANVQIHILDAHLQPMPIGVPGELCISGEGLARGYLERPGLTAEKFIPNLFSSEPGARLYRTGDLACWQPDGNIEFLGRIDNQVKIRGFRIELGEIESALSQHSGVREGVVIAHADASGDKRLVAYLVPQEGQTLAVSELRSFLKDKLPDYMLPAAFVMLDALPLTPSGKVDRRALPAPGESSLELAEAFAAPRTPTEEALADIWAEILHLERVGVRHNFFELGGHSLLAMQVVSRVRAAFQVELPVRGLFENPTVAELAEYLDVTLLATRMLQTVPNTGIGEREKIEL